jgi:hypothetical protein
MKWSRGRYSWLKRLERRIKGEKIVHDLPGIAVADPDLRPAQAPAAAHVSPAGVIAWRLDVVGW